MARRALGVGFVGAGPVTQAIHIPTLARLEGTFDVVHVVDVDADVAGSIGQRVGATPSTSLQNLLDDTRVEVVAVCSPHQFHAAQVVAACRAGKKAVLCEKPLATSVEEAEEIAVVAAETGVPVVVGAMHTFDPGWTEAASGWGALPQECHTIRSSIVLPPNPRFEDFATEVIARPPWPSPDLEDVAVRAALVHGGVMGLAIHDLPLVRALLPSFDDLTVHSAHVLAPFGYQVVLSVGGRRVVLHAVMSATWQPRWTFEAWSDQAALHVEFTPSYVQAGSAVSTLRSSRSSTGWGPTAHNGYEGEWRALAAIVAGEQQPPLTATLVEDLRFAIAVADGARARVLSDDHEVVAA